MNGRAMNVLQFVNLNRQRLEFYRKFTRLLAVVMSLVALVFFTGGVIRSSWEPGGNLINRYGFVSDFFIVFNTALGFIIAAFIVFSVGQYLHYLVNAEKSSRIATVLLPLSLVLVAFSDLYGVFESFYWIAQRLEAGIGPSATFSTITDTMLPSLTRSAATIGLAIIIVHLTRVIEEEKSLV